MRKHFALAFALLGLLLISSFADWVAPDPYDPAHAYSIGRAPIWSHEFAAWRGAHVDWGETGIYIAMLGTLAAVMAFHKR